MRRGRIVCLVAVIAAVGSTACLEPGPDVDAWVVVPAGWALVGQVSGAIFTTTVDGAIINENVRYEAKEDVYLDGGPGPNAPANAAGLPAGDYYFQVTDPSGKDLLSTDHIACRRIRVNDAGVIDHAYEGHTYEKYRGNWRVIPCRHATGVDEDHSGLGAITVQLFPYDNTPNRGGVYKVWITPVGTYTGDPDLVPSRTTPLNGEAFAAGNFHGFLPHYSKTDNYKVRRNGRTPVSPTIAIEKFHDANINTVLDADESMVDGWQVTVTDPLGVINNYFTPVALDATTEGIYSVVEDLPSTSQQTVSYLDQALVSAYPTASPTVSVLVAGDSEETHTVLFGNVGIGSIEACKSFDRDADGQAEADEPLVAGWRVQLTGTDVTGAPVGPSLLTTDTSGCATFAGLLPGSYTVEEIAPATGTWTATGATTFTATIESDLNGSVLAGTHEAGLFTNTCTASADFGTKGYWHNKNGLGELGLDDVSMVNALLPYSSPSSYFDAGDEPFDGAFFDGVLVAAVHGEAAEFIAPEGSWQAEVSQFLVDTNAGADPREQLAQQLLAFIFNTRKRLDGDNAYLIGADGSLTTAAALIADAIATWAAGSAGEQTAMASLLDAFNNGDAVGYVPVSPCAFSY